MEEIQSILSHERYEDIDTQISTYPDLIAFSSAFYKDVAEIFDATTRVRNRTRNPTGFATNDAAILGLLIRIWKILKEIVAYHEKNNADVMSMLDRQVIESAITARYLLTSNESVIVDYRKCSYKDRLRVLADAKAGSGFFETKSGKRLLLSVQGKLALEGFTDDSFSEQIRNKWKVGGKSFYQIFSEVMKSEASYKYLYGIPSESIHGSWNDSMDYHLYLNDDKTFSPYPFSQESDVRLTSPIIFMCLPAYEAWLIRIDCESEFFQKLFRWIEGVNRKLFDAFDKLYPSETVPDSSHKPTSS